MSWRNYIGLSIISCCAVLILTRIQIVPGYMDDAYYHLGGLQLAKGDGFTEPILWNYLDDPEGIPHPSHGYWMPLASIISAAGMMLTGIQNFAAGRAGFVIMSFFVPLLTASLSYAFSGRTNTAFLSGLLAIFSGFYFPYITTTDNFTLYMFFGGILFLLIPRIKSQTPWVLLSVGMITGIFHLSRSDGILWLPLMITLMAFQRFKAGLDGKILVKSIGTVVAGYLLIMAPWFLRNLSVYGSLLSPGGMKTLWLRTYNETFSYPSDLLSFPQWWESGLNIILKDRLWALGMNLQRTLIEQGLIFLAPLVVLGMWHYCSDIRVQTGFWAWLLTFSLMTFIFPYSGARGGFFHSGAVIQPLFWAVAPKGLGIFTEWGARVRGWNQSQAFKVFGTAMIIFSLALTTIVYSKRVIGPSLDAIKWQQPYFHYQAIESTLGNLGVSGEDLVMVKNPPMYSIAGNRSAIVIPDGDVKALLSAAKRYHGRYILLDQDHPAGLTDLFKNPTNPPPGLEYMLTLDGTQIFRVK